MRVDVSDAAESDLDDIGDWIAADSPQRAVTFTQEIRARCGKLGDMSQAFPLVPRHESSGIRRVARDIDAQLFPDE